jgi:hypothetical protein
MRGIARGKGGGEHKEGSMEGGGEVSLSLHNINILYSPSPCSQPSCNATLPMASFPLHLLMFHSTSPSPTKTMLIA